MITKQDFSKTLLEKEYVNHIAYGMRDDNLEFNIDRLCENLCKDTEIQRNKKILDLFHEMITMYPPIAPALEVLGLLRKSHRMYIKMGLDYEMFSYTDPKTNKKTALTLREIYEFMPNEKKKEEK